MDANTTGLERFLTVPEVKAHLPWLGARALYRLMRTYGSFYGNRYMIGEARLQEVLTRGEAHPKRPRASRRPSGARLSE